MMLLPFLYELYDVRWLKIQAVPAVGINDAVLRIYANLRFVSLLLDH